MNTTIPRSVSFGSLDILTEEAVPWLWQDYLAPGMVSLLTSQWKTGKTTLISVLLARLHTGGTLAGTAVTPGSATVISEEPQSLWQTRHHRLDFGPGFGLYARPFRGRPTRDQWTGLLDQIAATIPALVVVDPLAMFLPDLVENTASLFLEALEPLHTLTDRGSAVLLLHHPRKNGTVGELSPRGSGALPGFADILLELDRLPNTPITDRRRRLRATSRLQGSSQRIIELTADGRDYLLPILPPEPESYDAGWPVLRTVLEDAEGPLTRSEILKNWPEDFEEPSSATLWRWLDKAVNSGNVVCSGQGRRTEPYRYALTG